MFQKSDGELLPTIKQKQCQNWLKKSQFKVNKILIVMMPFGQGMLILLLLIALKKEHFDPTIFSSLSIQHPKPFSPIQCKQICLLDLVQSKEEDSRPLRKMDMTISSDHTLLMELMKIMIITPILKFSHSMILLSLDYWKSLIDLSLGKIVYQLWISSRI